MIGIKGNAKKDEGVHRVGTWGETTRTVMCFAAAHEYTEPHEPCGLLHRALIHHDQLITLQPACTLDSLCDCRGVLPEPCAHRASFCVFCVHQIHNA